MSEHPAIPEPPATETIPFSLPSEYAPAIDRVIALATEEILVFDRDLKDGEWNSAARADALRAFLIAGRRSRLQIVVHDTLYIEGYLPRLTRLLREFSHQVEILRTIDDGRNAWDDFVLVDKRHLVHRFHLESLRGESSLNNLKKTRELFERYEDILAFTEPGVNATQLGL